MHGWRPRFQLTWLVLGTLLGLSCQKPFTPPPEEPTDPPSRTPLDFIRILEKTEDMPIGVRAQYWVRNDSTTCAIRATVESVYPARAGSPGRTERKAYDLDAGGEELVN